MGGVLGQVRVEDDVDAARDAHLAAHGQPGVLGDLGAAAVGADQVLARMVYSSPRSRSSTVTVTPSSSWTKDL